MHTNIRDNISDCEREDINKDKVNNVYKATNDDEKEKVYKKIYVRECDDVNRNAKDDICKVVNKKGGLSE